MRSRHSRAHLLLLAPLLLALGGCWKPEDAKVLVDRAAFQRIGGTLFTNPDLLTMKEIHLDNGTLAGREIIIEGQVAEISEHSTYLVLTDATARMLVVLTDVDAAPWLKAHGNQPLRVLGTVESGKKGLPFIMARAVNLVSPAKA